MNKGALCRCGHQKDAHDAAGCHGGPADHCFHCCVVYVAALTTKQRECLRDMAKAPRGSWHYGSTTIRVLRLAGYIEGKMIDERTINAITAAGIAELERIDAGERS